MLGTPLLAAPTAPCRSRLWPSTQPGILPLGQLTTASAILFHQQGGPATRGTIVTITGSGFSGGTVSVQFGTTPAPAVTVNSATQITATSPPGSGTASVTVSNLSGTSAAGTTDRFGYLPAVTGISPASGPVTGATPVTITGAGFTGATSVRFGTTGAALTVNSDTQIAATSPPGPVRARPASP